MSLTAKQSKTGGNSSFPRQSFRLSAPTRAPLALCWRVRVTSHRVAHYRQAKKLTAG